MASANGSAPFVRITVKEETGTMPFATILELIRLNRTPTTAQLLRRKAGGHRELEAHLTHVYHEHPHHFATFCQRTPDGEELYAAFTAFVATNQGSTFIDFVRSVVQA